MGPETFKWDLGSLGLAPGDRVVYRIEIWDNDSISGPKKGTSQTSSFRSETTGLRQPKRERRPSRSQTPSWICWPTNLKT